MKRKPRLYVVLIWAKIKGTYELRRAGDEDNPDCLARAWGPEKGWDDGDFNFAVFHPTADRGEGKFRTAWLRGRGPNMKEVVALAEATLDTPDWWRGKKLKFDRKAIKL